MFWIFAVLAIVIEFALAHIKSNSKLKPDFLLIITYQIALQYFLLNMLDNGLPTKHGHLPSASTSIKSLAAAIADLRHILKRVRREDQE